MTTLMAASASTDAAPGALGFIVVFGLAVIMFFVFRSMSRHIRKVDEAARRDEAAAAAQTASTADDGAEPGRAAAGSDRRGA